MGKKSAEVSSSKAGGMAAASLFAVNGDVDPTLASLFSGSLGPVVKPSRNDPVRPISASRASKEGRKRGGVAVSDEAASPSDAEDDDLSEVENEDDDMSMEDSEGSIEDGDVGEDASSSDRSGPRAASSPTAEENSRKSRKRKHQEDDLEEQYMRRMARLEERDAAVRDGEAPKRQKIARVTDDDGTKDNVVDSDMADHSDDSASPPPQHETLSDQPSSEVEKASRTVFLGNVSTAAMTSKSSRKTLLAHLSSHLPALAATSKAHVVHKIESFRFRSTAYATAIPKRAAFAKKELMDATTKSTNAYVVYNTTAGAREAAKQLNGTVVLDRHLRVDEVAHPAQTDHRRCVFVGNLGFVDDESAMQDAEADGEQKKQKKKQKQPSDVEEGLWREFGKAGTVESVRVIRDAKTRVGKGFAYVQFTDENDVEAALLYNDKKFPPMLPRKLRVVRAKAVKRNAAKNARASKAFSSGGNAVYRPKMSAEQKSLQGRAGRLLGKAGAATLGSKAAKNGERRPKGLPASVKPPESFVFEGHRATSGQKPSLSIKKGKKGGKPQNRSSKRSAAWKASGGKKVTR